MVQFDRMGHYLGTSAETEAGLLVGRFSATISATVPAAKTTLPGLRDQTRIFYYDRRSVGFRSPRSDESVAAAAHQRRGLVSEVWVRRPGAVANLTGTCPECGRAGEARETNCATHQAHTRFVVLLSFPVLTTVGVAWIPSALSRLEKPKE
jgi:hypothetical protein